MSKLDKLKSRLLDKPKDFTWDELRKLLVAFGYSETNAGKTSGSRVRFVHKHDEPICLHKPHPRPFLKDYQTKQIVQTLKDRGYL